jgi:hypothetical protein
MSKVVHDSCIGFLRPKIYNTLFKISAFLVSPEGKFLVTKFEFGGRFGMSLEGDCREVEVTPKLEFTI